MPREIPVSELRPGLTVWKIDNQKFKKDVYLQDYFLGSYSPREWSRRIQFVTQHGNPVMWHPSGTVMVTNGNDPRKTIQRW